MRRVCVIALTWGGDARDSGRGLGLPPALESAVDTGCSGDLDDFAGDEGSDGERPCRRGSEMKQVGQPTGAEEKDGKRGCD